MHKHIESEDSMAKILDRTYSTMGSKDLYANAWSQLNSIRALLARHDAEATQVAYDNLETVIRSLESDLTESNQSELNPEIIAFSSEYEQKEIQMYLYVYGEGTATQIYNHLKTHFEYRGTMPPYITRSEVHSLLKRMLKSGYLRTRRVHFKVLYSLTQYARDRIMVD